MKNSSIRAIQKLVCQHFKMSRDDMLGPCRKRKLAWPRQMAMALCHEFTRQSLPGIGRYFQRDHTTVLYAHRVIQQREQEFLWVGETMLYFRQHLRGQTNMFVPRTGALDPPKYLRKIPAAGLETSEHISR